MHTLAQGQQYSLGPVVRLTLPVSVTDTLFSEISSLVQKVSDTHSILLTSILDTHNQDTPSQIHQQDSQIWAVPQLSPRSQMTLGCVMLTIKACLGVATSQIYGLCGSCLYSQLLQPQQAEQALFQKAPFSP